MDANPPDMPSYKPSAYYYRRELREAHTVKRAQAVGLAAVDDLERLKAWVREQGLIPPKWRVLREEARDKGWDRAG
jgi:hypothetical protein